MPSITRSPSWVKSHPIPKTPPIPSKEIDFLLEDCQINMDNETSFEHHAYRINDADGLRSHSKVAIHYNPTYQKLHLHTAQVIRKGSVIDKLDPKHLQLNKNHENHHDKTIYATLPLDDIREGDIIEYAYSLQGLDPVYKNHLSRIFALEHAQPLQKQVLRIISTGPRNFLYRCHQKEVPVKISTMNQAMEWEWAQDNIPAYKNEPDQPHWAIPYPILEISDYANWKDIVDAKLIAYQLQNIRSMPLEWKNLAAQWKKDIPQREMQALAALRYVQNGNHPHKVQALRSLLTLCDIESEPVLVSTKKGKYLKEFYPTPKLLNHAIVKINIGDQIFWADPTSTHLGGGLTTYTTDHFMYGLPLRKGQTKLISIPGPAETKVHCLVTLRLGSKGDKDALMEIKTDFYDIQADRFRKFYKSHSTDEIAHHCNGLLARLYEGSPTGPVVIQDDRDANHVRLIENYKIFNFVSDKESIEIRPILLHDLLSRQIAKGRKGPLGNHYPHELEETFQVVQRRGEWENETHKTGVDDHAFQFRSEFELHKDGARFTYRYNNLKNHIDPEHVAEYQKHLDEAKENSIWVLNLPKNENEVIGKEQNLSGKKFYEDYPIPVILVGLVLVCLILWLIKQRK